MKSILIFFVSTILLTTSTMVQAQLFTTYTTTEGLPDNYICGGLAVDGDNNIWAGTAVGLGKYNGSTWTSYTTADGLLYNLINCVAADSSGNIWIGTNNGVSVFNGTTWDTITTADGLIDNAVYYIFADVDGGIWFATSSGVTYKSGATYTTYTTADGLLSNSISYITQAPDDVIWVATQLGGYAKFTGSAFTSYSIASMDSLASDNIFAIAVDDAGTQFIGTWSGLSEVSTTGTWMDNLHPSDGLFNDFIIDLKIGANGNLWALCFDPYNTIGGLSGFDGTSWYSYSVADGLGSNIVTRIVEDLSGDIWVATGNGVSRLTGTLGIHNDLKAAMSVYPNPCSDLTTITTESTPDMIRIINTAGQTVAEVIPESTQTSISIEDFPAGMYVVLINIDNQTSCTKLIKE